MNYYFLNTGNANFSNGANWSDTDGGTPLGSQPVSTDDVFLTANSGDLTVDGSQTIKSLNCTGYTKTVHFLAGSLTLSSDLVLSPAMKIISDDFYLAVSANCSVTTNGCMIPLFRVNGTTTLTLLDALNVSDTLLATGNTTWMGNFGFITNNYTADASGVTTNTFKAGNTYTVKGRYSRANHRGNAHGKVVSSDSTNHTRANLIVMGVADIGYVDFTDIDASGGRKLYPFNGIVNNCVNIETMTDMIYPSNRTNAKSFVT